MSDDSTVNLWLGPSETDTTSKWTDATGELHFREYGFDDYDTEIIHLDAEFEHRTDIKALDWERTHRKWTDSEWQLDFAALEHAVKHFLDRGYTVTVPASEVSIFISDYDAAFLEDHLPADPPPSDRDADSGSGDEQYDLSEFS